jgi:hypothetical protein
VLPGACRRDENDHVVERDKAVELLEDGGDHQVAGLRARAVAHRDRHAAPPGELAQPRAGGRRLERVAQHRALVVGARVVRGSTTVVRPSGSSVSSPRSS